MTNKTGDKKPCSRPQKLEMIRYSCLTRFVVSPGISKSLWYHTFRAEADDRLALDLKVCLGIGAIASTSSYIVTLVSGDRGRWGAGAVLSDGILVGVWAPTTKTHYHAGDEVQMPGDTTNLCW